ncbi:MAG: hypothetical protein M3Z46_03295 [Actinomycetota bacterium]|nr:hypothetical protein [Actinomycetota bacterium]
MSVARDRSPSELGMSRVSVNRSSVGRVARIRGDAVGLLGLLVAGCVAIAACSSGSVGVLPSTTGRSVGRTTSTTMPTATEQSTIDVPPGYRTLSSHLSSALDAYEAAVKRMPSTKQGDASPVAAAELLPANGNRLEALLAPGTLPSVDAWLDRFHAMGIRGVTVGIKLPMLLERFGPDAASYTRFYTTVADHARRRGMTVDVELGALFCGTAYASCTSPFNGSYRQFVDDTVAQARIVIDRVRPRYLDILAEPTTEATLTGVHEFKTPVGAARYVRDVLAGIGERRSTKVGAGGATWLDPIYDEAILREAVDFLVVHIYPMSSQIAGNIVDLTALARRAHKPIVADEIGLYKTDTAGAGAATADSVYRLDAFSFFEPLDVRFLTITAEWAKKAAVAYVSPFWAGQFFAYIKWTPALDKEPFAALSRTSNAAIAKAFGADLLTRYGRTWPAALR